jgi:hypothetical protein
LLDQRILDSMLADQPKRMATHAAGAIIHYERQEYASTREGRYATATRRLLADGISKAAVSRMLGISTHTMGRLLREQPVDVALAADDPLREFVGPPPAR